MQIEKAEPYRQLVDDRKACRVCSGVTNPSVCGDGTHDSDQIGPWSLWQGNLDAELMVVGQDWADVTYFLAHPGRESANNPTNETLRKLLASIGIEIEPPSTDRGSSAKLFFTNAILCLKEGGLQASVKPEWFSNCGQRFLKPTVDLVQPRVVVTLGEMAYHAVAAAYEIPALPFKAAVEKEDGFPLTNRTTLYPVYHCGARILNTHRHFDQQVADWNRIRLALGTVKL